jgi:hypothetical protein
MPAGYSGTPLVKKLGIKSGFKILLVHPPDHYFDLLEELPVDLTFTENPGEGPFDFIHLFATEVDQLHKEIPALRSNLNKKGMLWISWPKGGSSIQTDLNGNVVRAEGLRSGLVDVKVCAVDEDWSGLKFVYRLSDRS